jgi:GNAT superfamily N-acetyltransferase
MEFPYRLNLEPELTAAAFVDILRRSTLDQRRPVHDLGRIERMLRGAALIATARDSSGLLVGVSRALTDFSYCTYLSDLAVDQQHWRCGIGRRLIEFTHDQAGRQATLILLSAPAAVNYYPHIGLQQHPSCWTLPGARDSDGGQ